MEMQMSPLCLLKERDRILRWVFAVTSLSTGWGQGGRMEGQETHPVLN